MISNVGKYFTRSHQLYYCDEYISDKGYFMTKIDDNMKISVNELIFDRIYTFAGADPYDIGYKSYEHDCHCPYKYDSEDYQQFKKGSNDRYKEEYPVILDRLSDSRVFCITSEDNKEFLVQECCDGYFSITLTRDELIQLANEILELTKS